MLYCRFLGFILILKAIIILKKDSVSKFPDI